MPESPEVKIMANCINIKISGWNMTKFAPYHKSIFRKTDGFGRLLPKTVSNVTTKGKFLYFQFTDGTYIGNSFGLSGKYRWQNESKSGSILRGKFTFQSSSKDSEIELAYIDNLAYGKFEYFDSKEKLDSKLKKLGPDVFSLTLTNFIKTLMKSTKRTPNKEISSYLMDQSKVAGIGNYLKSEILYKSKIHPQRKISSLSDDEIRCIYDAIIEICTESLNSGGSPKYGDLDGNKGNFKMKIYENKNFEVMQTKDGRKTWYDAKTQV